MMKFDTKEEAVELLSAATHDAIAALAAAHTIATANNLEPEDVCCKESMSILLLGAVLFTALNTGTLEPMSKILIQFVMDNKAKFEEQGNGKIRVCIRDVWPEIIEEKG